MPKLFLEDLKTSLSQYDHSHRREEFGHAAVSIVLFQKNSQWNLIMIQRAQRENDPWSGHMAFPGGRTEKGESLLETSIRETREEIGLDIKIENLIGTLEIQKIRYGKKILNLELWPFLFYLDSIGDLTPDPSEVSVIFSIPLEHLFSEKNYREEEFSFDVDRRVLPTLRFQNERIWGLSYLIIGDLIHKLQGFPIEKDRRLEINPWLPYSL